MPQAERGWNTVLFGDGEIAALLSDNAMLDRFLRFEIALVLALGDASLHAPERMRELAETMAGFEPDRTAISAAVARDGVPVPEFVRQLKHHAGPSGDGVIHRGATSQDLIDTAAVLGLLACTDIFVSRLSGISATLAALSQQHGGNKLMAYTRMQPALPIRVSDKVGTWLDPLTALAQTLPNIRSQIGMLQFGGAVGTLSELGDKGPEVATALGKRLGLPWPKRSWHSDRTAFAAFAGWLSSLTGALGKIGQDVSLMAARGDDEIILEGGGGSSAMPHKQNPVTAERLVALARFNASLVSAQHQALVHEQERSGAAWMLEWMTLPQMTEAAAASLAAADRMLGSIKRIGAL